MLPTRDIDPPLTPFPRLSSAARSNLDEATGNPKKIGYLAQHKLFAQFPDLLEDFETPAHCSTLGDELTSYVPASPPSHLHQLPDSLPSAHR